METTAVKTKWILDTAHSELMFKVKHMMITNVKGEFKNFSIEVAGSDIFKSTINVVIDASSITTSSEDRDKHLRGADFFDVEKYKELTFRSTETKQTGDDEYELTGMLTIKGISKRLVLTVEFGGTNKDPWGHEKAGFSISSKIKRSEWNLNWNAALETGGVLVSDEVKISGDIQLIKQKAE